MAKKRRGGTPRELTKRQISRWEAQRKRQRIIIIAGIFAVAAVVAVIGVGWYLESFRPYHQTVITVNGEKFNMQYLIDMIKAQAQNPQGSSTLTAQADSAVQEIEQDALIRQQAQTLGLSVSDDNVTQSLKALPNDAVHRDVIRTQLLLQKVRDDYLAKSIPTTASQTHIDAMLLEDEAQATDVRARLDKGESFADLAAQLSLNTLTRDSKGDVGWHPQDVLAQLLGSSVPGDYAFGSDAGTLSQPRPDKDVPKNVAYWLIRVDSVATPTTATVDAMLLGSQQQAQDVAARLKAGEDFATLGKEFSQMPTAKSDGGVLGVINKGNMGSDVFDNYVFSANVTPNVVSAPLRDDKVVTTGGAWLIKVLEKASDRPIDDNDLLILKNQALQDWGAKLLINPDNKIDDSPLTTDLRLWAIARAQAR